MVLYKSIIILAVLLISCSSSKFVHQYNDNIKEVARFSEEQIDDLFIEPEPQAKACMGVAFYAKELPVNLLPVLLSKIYGVEINFGQTSELKISYNHSNVCLEDLQDELTELYNIGFIKSSMGYSMYINALRTQFFTLNYHNFSRVTSSQTSIQSKSLADSNAAKTGYSAIETKLDDNFWDNVNKNISSLIAFGSANSGPGSSFALYKESGLIVVNSYPRTLKNIERFIARINKTSLKQVNIEARILEIDLQDEFSSGINWQALKGDFSVNPLMATKDNLVDLNSITNPNINTAVFSFKGRKGDYFNQVIKALSNQGKVSILSSPRVSVLNNQRAIIKFGEDGYYLTNVSSSIQTTANAANVPVVNSTINLTPFFSGIALDTTPKIINNKEVILHIHPTITRVSDKDKNITLSGQTTTLPLASIETREADTIVKANSGDMVIIGGLMQNDVKMYQSRSRTKNSLLNKFLDFFGNTQDYNRKSELVILLRPIIVDSEMSLDNMDQYLVNDM